MRRANILQPAAPLSDRRPLFCPQDRCYEKNSEIHIQVKKQGYVGVILNIEVDWFLHDNEHYKNKIEEQLLQNTLQNASLDVQICVDPSIK